MNASRPPNDPAVSDLSTADVIRLKVHATTIQRRNAPSLPATQAESICDVAVLRDALEGQLQKAPRTVEIEVAEVRIICSETIGMLLRNHRLLQEKGRTLRLVQVRRELHEQLKAMALDFLCDGAEAKVQAASYASRVQKKI